MRINKIYLEASFVSFVIHASIILYLLGFFYFESQERSLLSKPIEVSLIFQENVKEIKKNNSILETKNFKINEIPDSAIDKKSISFDSLIPSISLNDLIAEIVFINFSTFLKSLSFLTFPDIQLEYIR